jgi:hypothetical protein
MIHYPEVRTVQVQVGYSELFLTSLGSFAYGAAVDCQVGLLSKGQDDGRGQIDTMAEGQEGVSFGYSSVAINGLPRDFLAVIFCLNLGVWASVEVFGFLLHFFFYPFTFL